MVADVSQLMLAPAAEEHSMPHFDQQEPSMMPEFPEINMMSEFPEISMRQDENFGILEATPRAQSPGKQQYVLQSPIQTTPTKKTRRVAQKKRKVVDTEIELDSELQRRQLADTSDIQQPVP